jgi:hypothetical protein
MVWRPESDRPCIARATHARPDQDRDTIYESPGGKTVKSLKDVVAYLANDPSSGAKVEDFFFSETAEAGGLRTSNRCATVPI